MIRRTIQIATMFFLLVSVMPVQAQQGAQTATYSVVINRQNDGSFLITLTNSDTGQTFMASGVNPIDPDQDSFEGTLTVDSNQSIVSIVSQLSGNDITGSERAALTATVRVMPPPAPPAQQQNNQPGPPNEVPGPPDGAPPTPVVEPGGPPANPQGPVVPTPPVNPGNGGAGGSPT